MSVFVCIDKDSTQTADTSTEQLSLGDRAAHLVLALIHRFTVVVSGLAHDKVLKRLGMSDRTAGDECGVRTRVMFQILNICQRQMCRCVS